MQPEIADLVETAQVNDVAQDLHRVVLAGNVQHQAAEFRETPILHDISRHHDFTFLVAAHALQQRRRAHGHRIVILADHQNASICHGEHIAFLGKFVVQAQSDFMRRSLALRGGHQDSRRHANVVCQDGGQRRE